MECVMVKLFAKGTRTRFVDLVCEGVSLNQAALAVGASPRSSLRWWAQSGGMSVVLGRHGGLAGGPADPAAAGGRELSLADRGMIQMGLRQGMSYAQIGEAVGRNRSVVWREVSRNLSPDGAYYASVAHARARD